MTHAPDVHDLPTGFVTHNKQVMDEFNALQRLLRELSGYDATARS